jgi:hypothetical protein
MTTRRSPRRSANSNSKTAALRDNGSLFHVLKGGGLYALIRARALLMIISLNSHSHYRRNIVAAQVLTAEAEDRGDIAEESNTLEP